MDGIQPYAQPTRPPAASPPHAHSGAYAHPAPHPQPAPNPAAVKVASDYVRALRRRVWLVFMVGVPLGTASAVYAVRQPAIYRADALIEIKPPRYDPVLATMLSNEVGRRDVEATEKYLPNRVHQLKSKPMADLVFRQPAFLKAGEAPGVDASEELTRNLHTKIGLNTNYVSVSLDGTDPARAAKLLETLLSVFVDETKREMDEQSKQIIEYAELALRKLDGEITVLRARQQEMLRATTALAPDGSNMIQAQFENLGSALAHKRMRYEEVQQQAWVSQLFPKDALARPEDANRMSQMERLNERRRELALSLNERRRLIRNFENDPSVKHTASKLKAVMDQLEALQRIPQKAAVDPSETILATMREEIHAAEEASKGLMAEFHKSIPDQQNFLQLQEERELKSKRKSAMETKISEFQMLVATQEPPVTVAGTVVEPAAPDRPNRKTSIALGVALSFALGVALVCLMEHLDHSVKVPEHLTVGLTLPLLGVVPRIRRTASTHRGGHLWTPGAPDSVEADAYRNLRASLLGASDRLGPIGTLLVTSAKAGEGKSTTALNLAATCARAGERTLLVDVDLRRPSLAEVFEGGQDVGLVDALRGGLPWQRAVVRTDLPNLDFLPTGDTRDVPIEILGTLELRQLLLGLANHYDRVILDGPAVLGLADCRMLGRVVDSALLVVRSGAHEMRPLQRAKAMLEQSRVVIAGVVFNGLYEDLQNWSSYGPYQPYDAEPLAYRSPATRGGLGAPDGVENAELAGAARG